MKRSDWNFLVAALMFLDLCSVVFIGVLLAFVIPGGMGRTGNFSLGLHRHGWAQIHYTLALCFVVLLGVHIWLNWGWVAHVTKSTFGEEWKKFLYFLSGAWLLIVLVGWLIVKF